MNEKAIQPRLGTAVTMIVGLLFLFLLISQAGKYHENGFIVEKAKERQLIALENQRKKALLKIGVKPTAAQKRIIAFGMKPVKQRVGGGSINEAGRSRVASSGEVRERTNNRHGVAYYRVNKSDTLFRIATKVYGDGNMWRGIMKVNPHLSSPGALREGMRLKIPEPVEQNTVFYDWRLRSKRYN